MAAEDQIKYTYGKYCCLQHKLNVGGGSIIVELGRGRVEEHGDGGADPWMMLDEGH